VAQDAFGDMIMKRLTEAGVGTAFIRHCAEQTGVVISQVRPDGERSFLSYRGANAQRYGSLAASTMTPQDYLCLSGYSLQDAASAETAWALKSVARQCAFDPTYFFARDFKKHHEPFVAGIQLLTPNWEEAQLMTGRSTPDECAQALRDLGVDTVVVKLGAQGCYVYGEGGGQWVPTTPVTGKVDTTGAGDAFCGTLLAKHLQGAEIGEAARSANEAARRIVCS
jgi:sugar/nucleoside kinase (ribokinase family)